MKNLALHATDEAAFKLMRVSTPVWSGMDTAHNAIDLPENVLLHAGPPFTSVVSVSKPILHSACVAAVFEGVAENFDQAEAMIVSGEIQLKPAQDYSVVTPLAAVVSSKMPLHRVVDLTDKNNTGFAPINGGSRPAMRLGLCSKTVLEHIKWLNGPFADLLESGLSEAVELIPVAVAALKQGDDCHGRTPAGSRQMMKVVEENTTHGNFDSQTREFIDSSPSLFLNLWMAASKCIMMRATGVAGSSFVTAIGGNGVDAGIQISALPGFWFQAAASPPTGRFDLSLPPERALPAIGDSAVVEGLGLGAMAIHLSPLQQNNLKDFLPMDYLTRRDDLMCGTHPGFSELDCKFGLTARAAASHGHGPVIGLGILDLLGKQGRLGGGIYDMPSAVFIEAVEALEL